ncbi:hypothetical protein BDN70DRAFT_594765 [Pholiota conissans]|uniref:N-acetyltransferase domain-containing protein n=1 Tax=Pholiota conissans TaxID=109636 RepID=A0A9P5Z665_9AGAR|nr:hypothetical protein BDN70DRAFT_594765 [Pholiota conissans]
MMGDVTIRRIQNITPKETNVIADMLVRAFVNNPATPAMTGGNRELEGPLFKAMLRAGGLAGHLYVLENELREVLSIALWFGPGTVMFDTEEQRSLGFNDFMARLDDKTRNWWMTTYPQSVGEFLKTWLPKPQRDCWWLNTIGTDPKHQKNGYATQLLNYARKNVSSSNVLAFCSASKETAEYYSQVGFPVQAHMDASSPLGYDFPIFGHCLEV